MPGRPTSLFPIRLVCAIALPIMLGLQTAAPVRAEEAAFLLPQAVLDRVPATSFDRARGPGAADTVNLVALGTEDELRSAFARAGWSVAVPIGLRSSIHEIAASLARRSYPVAPVSTQYLFHRPQDLAFELERGDATRRHHVRFWKDPEHPDTWIGAASEDIGILIDLRHLIVSHRVDSQIDRERRFVETSLADGAVSAGACAHRLRSARLRDVQLSRLNAQRIRVFTDGELSILALGACKPEGVTGEAPAPDSDSAPAGSVPCR